MPTDYGLFRGSGTPGTLEQAHETTGYRKFFSQFVGHVPSFAVRRHPTPRLPCMALRLNRYIYILDLPQVELRPAH